MFKTNEIFGGTYQIIKEIGRGGAGVVYLAMHLRLQKYVVIKRIQTRYQDSPALRVETDILKNLHHPSLPQIYDFIVERGEVYTVMDYVEGRDFSQLGCGLAAIPPQMAMKWFRQLMEVLEYMHTRQHPIIHSDIKPANIMLRSDGEICLIDFNISLEGSQMGMIMGYSDVFASPEQVEMAMANQRGEAGNYYLDVRTDIYSAAATMYYMITGILPNIEGKYPKLTELQDLSVYPSGFLAILDRCLSVDRNRRYSSATKVLKALDNLKKQDIRYRRFLLLQGLSWIGCALLISCGIFLVVRGTQKDAEFAYQREYVAFYESAVAANDSGTVTIGYGILNESRYQRILKKNPSDKAMILHAIGEAYYRMEDYQGAVQSFAQAVEEADSSDINLGNYYMDYAFALAECGNYSEARSKIMSAGNAVSRSSILLLDAKIAQQSGDNNTCIQNVQAVLSIPGSAEECSQACLLAAQSVGMTTQSGIEWLEYALQYKPDAEVLRQLGSSCISYSGSFEKTSDRSAWIEKAKGYYGRLCSQPDVTEEDWLGYAIAFYVSGDNESCLNILKSIADRGSEDYRVYLYLALSSEGMKNYDAAKIYCIAARDRISRMTQQQRDSADAGMMSRVSELAAQLGV